MRHSRIALALTAIVAASPAFAAVNLVTNGDFTDLTNGLGEIRDGAGITTAVGWTTPGFNLVLAVADQAVTSIYGANNFALWDQANSGSNTWNGLAPVGNILAMAGYFPTEYNPSIPRRGAVSQTVQGLTQGQNYVLAFDYAFGQQHTYNGPTVQSLKVDMGSSTFQSVDYPVADHGFVGWRKGQLNFTATSSSEVLSFLAHGNVPVPPFALVSDVSVTASIPEPATWALMLAGIAGLAYVGRLSSRRKAVVADRAAGG